MSGMTMLKVTTDVDHVFSICEDLTNYVNLHNTADGWTWPNKPTKPPVLLHDDLGIDVSFYQSSVDWNQVKIAGYKFAFIKSSESTFTDQMFKTHWANAKAAGVLRGAYHYFRKEADPIAQAQLLVTNAADAELDLVLDVETQKTTGNISTMVLSCLKEIERLTSKKPMIYTGKYVWADLTGNPSWANDYPLWVAQYPFGDRPPAPAEIYPLTPSLPVGWSTYAYWQYTSKGTVPGIAGQVDLDIHN